MATDLKRAYQIERKVDQLMQSTGWADDPFAIHGSDALYAEAERAVDAEARGERQAYVLVVAMGISGRYEAFTPGGAVRGCEHTAQSVNLTWACLEALTDHQQRCIGRQVTPGACRRE